MIRFICQGLHSVRKIGAKSDGHVPSQYFTESDMFKVHNCCESWLSKWLPIAI
jgi:hypothetical protein